MIAGAKWSDVGAKLRITHTNYKVIFPSLNNHFVTFNGTKYLTDVNGIDWLGIYFGTKTALLRERCYDMTVTFENGQTSLWKSARTSEWGIKNYAEIYATVNGDTIITVSYTHLDVYKRQVSTCANAENEITTRITATNFFITNFTIR